MKNGFFRLKIIGPLGAITTLIIASFISETVKAYYNVALQFMITLIREYYLYVIILVLIILVLILAPPYIFKTNKKSRIYHPRRDIYEDKDWAFVKEFIEEDVYWEMYEYKPLFSNPFEEGKFRTFIVENTPLCPKCKSELKQISKRNGYKWECLGCGFSKNSKKSFQEVVDSIENGIRGIQRASQHKKQ